jgi:hypothetical protein
MNIKIVKLFVIQHIHVTLNNILSLQTVSIYHVKKSITDNSEKVIIYLYKHTHYKQV